MHVLIRSCAFAAILGLGCSIGAARADAWPEFKTPIDASVETIAADMLLNGKQCRMLRFQVHASSEEVMTFYRTEFGRKHVENRLKDDRVIATMQGDYFVTVQLHTLDAQTVEGTTMSTMIAGKPEASAVLVDTKKLLPADTQVVSTVQTGDAARRSLMVVAVNRNSVQANRDHVVDTMAERGFRLTKQGTPQAGNNASSVLLELASSAEEASVTIADAGPYRSVVINRVRASK